MCGVVGATYMKSGTVMLACGEGVVAILVGDCGDIAALPRLFTLLQ